MKKKSTDDKQAQMVIGKVPSLIEFAKLHFPSGFKMSDIQREKLEQIVKDVNAGKKYTIRKR